VNTASSPGSGSGRRLDAIWILSLISVIGLLVVNIAGFVDTDTGSALGCGNQWPLCNNSVIPAFHTLQTIIEFAHRSIVSVVTLLLIVTSVLAWRRYGKWLEVKVSISLMLGFVFLEAFLGALGVLIGDSPAVLAVHFGVSMVAFASSVLLMVVLAQIQWALGRHPENPRLRQGALPKGFRLWTGITVVYTYLAMYVGAYIASIGAGDSFRGFPFPTENFQQAGSNFYFDVLHRSIALGLVVLCVGLLVATYRVQRGSQDLKIGAWLACIFVILQGISGGLLVLTHLSMGAFLFHVTNISCLFAVVSCLYVQTLPEPRRTALRETTPSSRRHVAPTASR